MNNSLSSFIELVHTGKNQIIHFLLSSTTKLFTFTAYEFMENCADRYECEYETADHCLMNLWKEIDYSEIVDGIYDPVNYELISG